MKRHTQISGKLHSCLIMTGMNNMVYKVSSIAVNSVFPILGVDDFGGSGTVLVTTPVTAECTKQIIIEA